MRDVNFEGERDSAYVKIHYMSDIPGRERRSVKATLWKVRRALRDPSLLRSHAASHVRRRFRPALTRAFHKDWYDTRVWQRQDWMGVTIRKCPFDLMVFQELFYEIRPDVVLETGTFGGGSALYYAHLMDLLGIDGRVVSVDVCAAEGRPSHPKIEYLLGSSTSPEVVEVMRVRAAGGSQVMVFLDSDHAREHVFNEMTLYAPLVTPGSYMVVEDTHANGHPVERSHGPGPMEAVADYLDTATGWEIDNSREKFLVTFNPRGYLRKRMN